MREPGGRRKFGEGVQAPNRTIALTYHETAERPGSSGATVTWCLHRAPGWTTSPSEAAWGCVHGSDAVQ